LTILPEGKKPILEPRLEHTVSSNISNTYLKLSSYDDNTQRLLVYQNTQLQIWDEKEKLTEWKPPQGLYIVDACYSARGEFIYTILSNNYIYVLNTTLSPISSVRLKDTTLTSIAANPVVANQVAVGTESGHIQLLDLINK